MTGGTERPVSIQPALSTAEHHRNDMVGLPKVPGSTSHHSSVTAPRHGVQATLGANSLIALKNLLPCESNSRANIELIRANSMAECLS